MSPVHGVGRGNDGDIPLPGSSLATTGTINGKRHSIGASAGIGMLGVLHEAASVIPEGPGPCCDLPR